MNTQQEDINTITMNKFNKLADKILNEAKGLVESQQYKQKPLYMVTGKMLNSNGGTTQSSTYMISAENLEKKVNAMFDKYDRVEMSNPNHEKVDPLEEIKRLKLGN